ncbi:YciI family protein [Neptunicella marina]|uniref:YCII-related domain-containing protein n=1 Tax=Neptunicella marina TaxID=2125989 RepID=A0A8J6LW99_9ALTE|nr:YciI family protein [Neptunicella marina]MBC3765129.1 hypothetical protein [Neptunicella marina]
MFKFANYLLILLSLTFFNAYAEHTYNQQLAEQLGADQYGMKSYVLVILVTGSQDDKITDPQQREALFKGHFANMSKLAENSKLVLAGPLMDAKPKRGIFILNTASIDDAREMVEADPAVKAGIFNYELFNYYGSAALMKINDIHKTIQKTSIE